ncbi:hypothetical protein F5Y16DRAFT_288167 [Xylariaceae sp. FL0255]|nr:hypothetical protein F5Y16DRAFT_288167 [Xylariaceae sp. FL0255]
MSGKPDISLHYLPLQCERRPSSPQTFTSYRPRDVVVRDHYSNRDTRQESHVPLDLLPVNDHRSTERRSKNDRDNYPTMQGSWSEPVNSSRHKVLESQRQSESARSQSPKTILKRFGDGECSDKLPRARHGRRDSLGVEPGEYLRSHSGNRDGETRSGTRHSQKMPRYPHAADKSRVRIPATPVISRLSTPDLEIPESRETGCDHYDFCACCVSYGKSREDETRWKRGRVKMDKQVDDARAYISRMTIGDRLLTDA